MIHIVRYFKSMKINLKKKEWYLVNQYILSPYIKIWTVFILLSLLAGCLPTMVYYGLSYFVDNTSLTDHPITVFPKNFFSIMCAMTLALLGINILPQIQYLVLDHLRDHIKFSVKHCFLTSILGENDLAILESKESSALLSDATHSFENLGLWIDHLGTAIMSASSVLFLLLLGFSINWWIPLLLLLTAMPSAVTRYKVVDASFRVEKSFEKHHYRLSIYDRIITHSEFFKEVRLFGLKDFLLSSWQKNAHECGHAFFHARINGLKLTAIATLLGSSVAAICTLYFAWSVMIGHISPGSLIIVIGVVLQLSGGLNFLIFSLYRATETAKQVIHLLVLIDRFNPKSKADVAAPLNQSVMSSPPYIEVSDVSFVYPDTQEYALQGISLTIKPNSKIAIVGENGAGKTTLIKLLTGLLRPTHGFIKIEETDLATVEKPQFWAGIGAVFQDHAKFPLSANLNVAFGDINRLDNQDDINLCLEQVGLTGLQTKSNFSKEDIYSEPSFSGGQWQRLAMARALFRASKIQLIVLDEPTSALDPNSEYELFEHFLELANNKTTIFVTHRLALAREADIIVVLDKGRIVETGSHNQLLVAGGSYSVMFARQASRYMDS